MAKEEKLCVCKNNDDPNRTKIFDVLLKKTKNISFRLIKNINVECKERQKEESLISDGQDLRVES